MSQDKALGAAIPLPLLVVFRGIGQVFFQENALSGVLFAVGIALSLPMQALGLVIGAVIGPATAYVLKFDKGELHAGIYGFNAALVGIATWFFFDVSAVSIGLMVVGCVVATVLTRFVRGAVPFPTYTAPFVVTTWIVRLIGLMLETPGANVDPVALVANVKVPFAVEATLHGVGQVMFQGSLWTGILFLVGIAVSDKEHAAWVLAGSIVGMLVATYHVTFGTDLLNQESVNPETLGSSTQLANIRLGLYGYNATLAPVAVYLWRRSFVAPVLSMLLTVPITEFMPLLLLPALTAPFVLATWVVLVLGWLEGKYLKGTPASAS